MMLPDNGVLKSTGQKKWFQKLMKKLPYRGVFNNVKKKKLEISLLNTAVMRRNRIFA